MATFTEIAGRIAHKLGQEGPRWLWRRVVREFKAPTTGFGKRFLMLRLRVSKAAANIPPASPDTLIAFYDLQVSPVTYNVIWFVAGAEMARRRASLNKIHFVVVPGWEEGLREEQEEYERVVDRDARRARLVDMLVPVMNLLPASAGVTLAASRAEAARLRAIGASVYPSLYDPAFAMAHDEREVVRAAYAGEPIAKLESSRDARRHVERWIETHAKGRKLITVTLRYYDYMPMRNSNLDAWSRLAADLDPREYAVLFIPDTEQSFLPLPDTLKDQMVAFEAAWNVGLRMAFYEAAHLNLGVNGGPLMLCFFNPAIRCIMFKMLTQAVPQSTKSAMRGHGFELGKNLPFATQFQKWVWEDDTLEVIGRETRRMLEKIAADIPDESFTKQHARL